MRNLRNDFPILKRKIHGLPLVYFDNAATTQKPRAVIDAMSHYYERTNANIHRGIHTLAEEATEAYEGARKKIADFIGAKDPAEIIFVRNATEGINLVAYSYYSLIRANRRIVSEKEQGVILLTEMEHHSNLVPWQMLNAELGMRNYELGFIPVKKDGTLDYSTLDQLITKKTALVSVAHASNVLGTINDIPRIVRAAHKKGVPVLVDAAQSVPHMPIDVQKLGCDFLVFSGHKMLGPTGIGVLWGRRELLEAMPPFLGGGDMIRSVRYDGFEPNDLPWKFEAGTPNIAGAIGLGAAIDYLQKIGMQNIRKHEMSLTKYALGKMQKILGLTIYGPQDPKKQTGVISFNLDGVHAHDLATIMDREGVAIRSGQHCAEPLVRKFGQTAMARVSFYLYNTKEEVNRFIEALKKAKEIFK
ncbi:cysteine desulfurase [Candidatus Uhrbacteria bacterium]|nr:cysteine desulfurase [Candidatus Uhrbacteria bacterium]